MEWPAVVTALSTAAIAILLALPAVASFLLFRELRRAVRTLEQFSETIQREVVPAVQAARSVAEQATEIVGTVKAEVKGIADTSSDLRKRVQKAADATEDRLNDLEALLDVLYEEVEETALDVAAALRTTRRGVGVIGAVKRMFGRKR